MRVACKEFFISKNIIIHFFVDAPTDMGRDHIPKNLDQRVAGGALPMNKLSNIYIKSSIEVGFYEDIVPDGG